MVMGIGNWTSHVQSILSPGAGKTTISQAAVSLLGAGDDDGRGPKGCRLLYLDLDVCVPQWMRVSFRSWASVGNRSSTCNICDNRHLR